MAQARTWRSVIAWLVILAVATVMVLRHQLPGADAEGADEGVAGVLAELQSKYLVGAAELLPGQGPLLLDQADTMLNVGTVRQRQKFVVLAGRLAGPVAAREQLDRLEALQARPPVGTVELTESDLATQRLLGRLYPPGLDESDPDEADRIRHRAIGELAGAEREQLIEALGWFGRLALVAGPDQDDAPVLAGARRVAQLMLAGVVVGGAALLVGFAGLVVVLVLLGTGRMRRSLPAGAARPVVYLETFAIWMVLFVGLQAAAGAVPTDQPMLVAAGGFFLSLVALAWPALLGVPWRTVRGDLGLTLGDRPPVEPLVGLAGYLLTLPLMFVGILMTLTLLLVQQAAAGPAPTFSPAGGPAHPVVSYMSGPDAWPKLQVLLLAAVAAPIVEETMFRGALYRYLREATRSMRLIGSIAVATLVNTFIFAVIHPQGFVAVPALMSLAIGMTLVREWRGTLLPSMIMHGVNNGLLMTMLWTLLVQ